MADVCSGLHFNASHACSANLVGFNLEGIAEKFESAAPATWSLVQMLLDANAIVQHHKQKASRESTDHHVQPGETTLIGAESDNGSSVEDSDEESVEEDGSQGRHGSDRRVAHRLDTENEALLPIVS